MTFRDFARPILGAIGINAEARAELRRFYRALTSNAHTAAYRRRILLNERNALALQRDFLTSRVNHLTAERNNLSAQVGALSGERNDLARWADTVIAERNDLIEKINALTGESGQLAGQVDDLTAESGELLGRLNALTAEHTSLTNKIHTLNSERLQLVARLKAASFMANSLSCADRQHGDEPPADAGAPEACPISPSPPAGRAVAPRKVKFLIVSNMRSGSTFLETLLGGLPGVYTDFEVKLSTPYDPAPTHHVIDANKRTVSEFLASLDDESPIVGSKLVFDEFCMTPAEFKCYWDRIGADVRIIHLTRSYRDVFLSRHRGFLHKLNEASEHSIGRYLKEAIIKADMQSHSLLSAHRISPLDCYQELSSYLLNDAQAYAAREPERAYLLIDYSDIHRRINEIVDFIGSRAKRKLIDGLLEAPPTLKLPAVDPAEVVSNIAELEPYFEHFNALREHLLELNKMPEERSPAFWRRVAAPRAR